MLLRKNKLLSKITLLSFISVLAYISISSAHANTEWKKVGETNLASFYVDKSTIRKQSKYTLMWRLDNLKTALENSDRTNFLSTKALNVFNCQERTWGIKTLVQYESSMGDGLIISSTTLEMHEVKFEDVIPDSIAEILFMIACGKK